MIFFDDQRSFRGDRIRSKSCPQKDQNKNQPQLVYPQAIWLDSEPRTRVCCATANVAQVYR
ncbi:hypothetical protein DU002_14855 [Corallincola holothuriorum]|uniref:Uncharacterized protein n=1 Tax=Corallincola holothuriorum TaxID=2282215 RepID=A0A368N853_9GAMM|nr:hypothetical protein DU002_14855 [Corallincola holothuriorum]